MVDFANVVAQRSTTSGTADFVVSGTAFNSQALSVLVDGEIYGYRAYYSDGLTAGWEVGRGAWASGTSTLARTTIEASSNAGSKVSFTSAEKFIEIALTGDQVRNLATLSATISLGAPDADIAVATGLDWWTSPNFPIEIIDIYLEMSTAPTGATAIFDVNTGGTPTSIFTTDKLRVDAPEFHSKDASTQNDLSTPYAVSARTRFSFDCDAIGTTVAGKGPKVTIEYRRT